MKKFTFFMLIVFMAITLQGQNKLLSSVDEFYDGTSWQQSSGVNYEYDSNNNLITESYLSYNFLTSGFKISYKTIYVYDASNKVTVSTDQRLNATTNMLENSYRSTLSYISGKYAGQTDEKWNSLSSSWVNEWKNVITYNSNNLPESALSYNWNGLIWELDSRNTLTYNGNKVISDLSENWRNSQWVNSSKEIYTYDANNRIITDQYDEWDNLNSLFIENYRNDYTFDASSNRIVEIGSWTDTQNNTSSKYKKEYSYDSSSLMSSFANPFKDKTGVDYLFSDIPHVNKVLSYNSFYYNTTTSTYDNTGRTTYNYNNSIPLGTDKFETEKAILTIYPNPTQDFLTIQTSLNTVIDKVIVADISGKIVLQKNQNTNQVNVQNLAKGMYLLQIFSGDKNWQSKFLKD